MAASLPPPLPPFQWRRLGSKEIDHEALWLGTSATTLVLGGTWLGIGGPMPHCLFKALTGCPCLTCGGTRAFLRLIHGNWAAAFAFNPLVTLGLTAGVLYNFYALAVLAGRLPRLRLLRAIPPASARRFRYAVLLMLAANWVWVIRNGN